MGENIKKFDEFRSRLNEKILSEGPLPVKRFFSLDNQVYQDGALPKRTKELLGLVASAVLRCDDCITYHLRESVELGISDEELWEALSVALIVGGSITIPHLRRAVAAMEELREGKE